MLEIIPPITHIETIAEGRGIHELSRLRRQYGPGNWKKKKALLCSGSEMALRRERSFTGMRLMVLER